MAYLQVWHLITDFTYVWVLLSQLAILRTWLLNGTLNPNFEHLLVFTVCVYGQKIIANWYNALEMFISFINLMLLRHSCSHNVKITYIIQDFCMYLIFFVAVTEVCC